MEKSLEALDFKVEEKSVEMILSPNLKVEEKVVEIELYPTNRRISKIPQETKKTYEILLDCGLNERALELEELFEKNRKWAQSKVLLDPDFFLRLSNQQHPEFLWIGCSDSRVPANEICNMDPGTMFVHRNIANVVIPTDINAQSVIEYAVKALKVKHILVCGHYGCGGVNFAFEGKDAGFLNPWITHIRDVSSRHKKELKRIPNIEDRRRRLVELNVIESCFVLMKNKTIQQSFSENGHPVVQAVVYDIRNAILKDLGINFLKRIEEFKTNYWLIEDHIKPETPKRIKK